MSKSTGSSEPSQPTEQDPVDTMIQAQAKTIIETFEHRVNAVLAEAPNSAAKQVLIRQISTRLTHVVQEMALAKSQGKKSWPLDTEAQSRVMQFSPPLEALLVDCFDERDAETIELIAKELICELIKVKGKAKISREIGGDGNAGVLVGPLKKDELASERTKKEDEEIGEALFGGPKQ